jgi:hypothetical protein
LWLVWIVQSHHFILFFSPGFTVVGCHPSPQKRNIGTNCNTIFPHNIKPKQVRREHIKFYLFGNNPHHFLLPFYFDLLFQYMSFIYFISFPAFPKRLYSLNHVAVMLNQIAKPLKNNSVKLSARDRPELSLLQNANSIFHFPSITARPFMTRIAHGMRNELTRRKLLAKEEKKGL